MFSQQVWPDVYLYKDGEVSLAEKNLIELLFFFNSTIIFSVF